MHRDYKPANVLVSGEGISKLTDFGLAVRTGDRPPPAGTLLYVAPEQLAGAPASPAGDVYSAAATFYECLTGHPPFNGESADFLRQHHAQPLPLDPVPAPLRSLVAAGMAEDPQRRPANAATFVTELQTVAFGAYGKAWEQRGRSHLGEAAFLLAALWPSGAPPAMQGATMHRVSLLRHTIPAKAAIVVGAAVIVVGAGTALAATNLHGPRLPNHPAAAVQRVSLQPTLSTSVPPPPTSAPAPASVPSSTSHPILTVPPTSTPPSTSAPPHTSKPPPQVSPSTSASASASVPPSRPSVPQITSVRTYTKGAEVYFDIQYADSGHDAEGFGFIGVNGSGWAEEQHSFSGPSYGIVGPDSIAYPFNLECGTTSQASQSYVEAWIYDAAGVRSQPAVIRLACT